MSSKKSKKELKKKFPWRYHLYEARKRCNNPNHMYFYCYGGKGIKCQLTVEEIKELWFRDKAYLMKRPSIDRIKNYKDYDFNNCQFIENDENSAKDKRKQILQYTKNGCFIKEWISLMDIERTLKIYHSSISLVCQNKRKFAGGFIWKYKNELNGGQIL